MNGDSLAQQSTAQNSYTLLKRISAIRLENRAVLQMPVGSCLEICGDGFNRETVKVRCNGLLFFVFREDLQSTAN